MIHIAVPDTQTLIESDTGRSYTAFNLHLNGAFHASVRYSHLLRLHEKLRDQFGFRLRATDFPAKKLFRNLDGKALKERRLALARYFQSIVQQPDVAMHFITEHAFLMFQVESFRPSSSNVSVDVYLADGSKETVRCNVEHPTDIILKRFAEIIGLDVENLDSFGLFLARNRCADGSGQMVTSSSEYPDMICDRLLRNFESPYVSLQLLNQKSAASGIFYRILVRKLVWDPRIEEGLLEDPGAVLILYKQAVNDLRNKHLGTLQPVIAQRLCALEEQGSCLQFLRLCHLQPGYSYEYLETCISDYPRPDTSCELKVGRRHIVLEYSDPSCGNSRVQAAFRATRIRVWRIAQHAEGGSNFIFQFEYLISKDNFEWITLITKQAVLLSLLLQSIGAEILKEHKAATFNAYEYERSNKTGSLLNVDVARKDSISTVSDEVAAVLPADPLTGTDHLLQAIREKCQAADSDSVGKDSNGNSRSLTVNGSDKTPLEGGSYESFKDVFTTISNALPTTNEIFDITDDDL